MNEVAPRMEGERSFDRESTMEKAMGEALDLLEEKVPEGITAAPAERLAALSELMDGIAERSDNADRYLAEALAQLRRLAELEQSFHDANAEFERVLH